MRRLLTGVLSAVLALPAAARADSIQLVARAGVTRPFGDVGDGVKLADSASWAFPLEAQASYRLTKELGLGAYARWAPTSAASPCSGCTVTDGGLGALAEYRFGEGPEGGWWLGLAAGWEQLHTSQTGSPSAKASGLEGAVSAGVDFEVAGLALGPYLQLSLGQFSKATAAGSTRSVQDRGVHGFFGAGLRVALLL